MKAENNLRNLSQSNLKKFIPEVELLWDAHIHLFPPKLFQAIYRVFKDNYGWNLAFSDYHPLLINYLKDAGIDRASVLVYAHKPNISLELNRWLAKLIKEHPWLVPYGCIHPADENLEYVLYEALDLYDFPGLKIHSLVKRIPPDDGRFFPVYEALEQKGKGVIIHTSTFPLHLQDCVGINYLYNILHYFPNLKILIPHMGLFELEEYSTLLQKYPHIYLDTSFVFNNHSFTLPLEELKKMIMQYPDRIIYGSDFPFIINEPYIDMQNIQNLHLPGEIYARLFYHNARIFSQ